jgi:hypothetical protein
MRRKNRRERPADRQLCPTVDAGCTAVPRLAHAPKPARRPYAHPERFTGAIALQPLPNAAKCERSSGTCANCLADHDRYKFRSAEAPAQWSQQMTDATELPQPSKAPAIKRWRVEMADQTARLIEARGFRVESGALVLVQPAGCAAAYAPSTWLTIEEIHTEG